MKQRMIALVTAALLLTLAPVGIVAQDTHAQVPPGPTTRHQFRVPGVPIHGPYEIIHLVLDFAPGAWTPMHVHGGQGIVTVLTGTMTRRAAGAEAVYRAGEGWVEPGVPHQAGNATAEPSAVLVTFLVPQGAPVTTVHGGGTADAPPGPTTRSQFRTAGMPIQGAFELVHLVLDFAAGAWTPPHTHGGRGVVTVLEGTMARRSAGSEHTYRPGESWVEPGVPHQAGNGGADPAAVMVTFLLPQGAPLTTVAPAQPGLPNTGAGGGSRPAPPLWTLLLLGGELAVVIAAVGWRSRRART